MKSMEVFSELRKEGTCCCVMVRLQVSWLPAVRAVTQLRNRLLHCRIHKSLTTSFWGLFWFCHCDICSLRNLVVSLLTIFVLKLCRPYHCGYLKLVTLYRVQKVKATYQLILTFRLKASIFTACLSPDILGVNDKVNDWDGDSRQMWAEQVINCDKW